MTVQSTHGVEMATRKENNGILLQVLVVAISGIHDEVNDLVKDLAVGCDGALLAEPGVRTDLTAEAGTQVAALEHLGATHGTGETVARNGTWHVAFAVRTCPGAELNAAAAGLGALVWTAIPGG
jgi:hypothetical protein